MDQNNHNYDIKKIGPERSKGQNRKDKIEQVLAQARKIDDGTDAEVVQAWRRLCRELEFMTLPESRPPRFAGLLRAVWVAATNEQS